MLRKKISDQIKNLDGVTKDIDNTRRVIEYSGTNISEKNKVKSRRDFIKNSLGFMGISSIAFPTFISLFETYDGISPGLSYLFPREIKTNLSMLTACYCANQFSGNSRISLDCYFSNREDNYDFQGDFSKLNTGWDLMLVDQVEHAENDLIIDTFKVKKDDPLVGLLAMGKSGDLFFGKFTRKYFRDWEIIAKYNIDGCNLELNCTVETNFSYKMFSKAKIEFS